MWEFSKNFDPASVSPHNVHWVRSDGSVLSLESREMTAFNGHISPRFVIEVLEGQKQANADLLAFRDPNYFVAGGLHQNPESWSHLLESVPSFPQATEVLNWIYKKVDVLDFFRPFQGCYKGEQFNSMRPPPKIFANHMSCKPFRSFISASILERLRSGAISLRGKVGEVEPPHLVLPLTVEPSKPWLCNEDRFLNLWIDDRPFNLDTLGDLTRYVFPDSFQTVCDDKSGYDHILLSENSRTYFGFQWGGWFFVSNCLPFGWKSSAFIYHTTGSLVSHYLRSKAIPCSLYIDDQHISQLIPSTEKLHSAYEVLSEVELNHAKADAAIFVVCYTLTSLGYTIGLSKSILMPSTRVPYLGFVCDSHVQAFTLLPRKREKLLIQLKDLLSRTHVDLLSLQKIAGKCVSMALAVPGARLFINEINLAVSRCTKSIRPQKLDGMLRLELEHWLFLENWDGFLP